MYDEHILATLDGKPVREGGVLYGLDGCRYFVFQNTSHHREFQMRLLRETPRPGRPSTCEWFTNTHWEGIQVVFWEPRTPEQIAEFSAWEEAEEYDARFNKRREWLANLTDPDAYMIG